ncbi:uncharacterized protein KY384_001758 [Bacidia gigantensis]|uniref:uncharacterized protein n=1 Tax=Bacidia gigantensis TaxID=2732470 RepID=UPI001D041F0E|nr:uncharacterized protein KY384_001758 [Bacidia gigantensis]KAG8532976.1 hypothetical protein KY384_001758 [Bacidia gigantensis]
MSTWMYQFWLFSFKTAKHWGRGPQDWTADILGFNEYHQKRTIMTSLPGTPEGSVSTPASYPTPQEGTTPNSRLRLGLQPSSLCKWSIHCTPVSYQKIPSPPPSINQELDFNDEESWPVWPNNPEAGVFTEKLIDGIENNHFSSIQANNLPITTDQVASAARGSPEELLKESIGFSIMGRNERLLEKLLKDKVDLAATELYPFHLAVSYLDGSQTCCSIIETILALQPLSLRKLFVNHLGHTVLDQLMICILKSHTSCLPFVVDDIFKRDKRFEGEDVSICGRWDADSDCVKNLLAHGVAGIPFEWKHMFCHTSCQTICDCIGSIFGPPWGPDVNHPSGLFGRRCTQCGAKLQPLPLHTLILVALHLSVSGREGENLFGILACLVCLLRYGANPNLSAEISLKALIGDEDVNGCSHRALDPLQLAEELLISLKPAWSEELDRGWQILCNTLRLAKADTSNDNRSNIEKNEKVADEYVEFWGTGERTAGIEMYLTGNDSGTIRCPYQGQDHTKPFGDSKILGSLWAAIQTELLTYRRLKEGDPWISPNFDMRVVELDLMTGQKLTIPLLQNGMIRPFCCCGNFPGAIATSPTATDATTYHFSNLEDWKRSTFLYNHEERYDSWYYNPQEDGALDDGL